MNALPRLAPRLFLFAALAAGLVAIQAPAAFATEPNIVLPGAGDPPAAMPALASPAPAAEAPALVQPPAAVEPPAMPEAPATAVVTKHVKHEASYCVKPVKHTKHAKHVRHTKSGKHVKHKKHNKFVPHPIVNEKPLSNPEIHDAQVHLINLGYYPAPADGLTGPRTRAALKAFQKDHHLVSNGELTPETALILSDADKVNGTPAPAATLSALPSPDYYAQHPDYYGNYDPSYGDALQLAHEKPRGIAEGLPSRFAYLYVTEVPSGNLKRYNVTLNGNPLLQVDHQPTVIGVSKTFNLGTEDAIVFSTYNSGDSVCAYKHYLLTLRDGSNELRPLENCTRRYLAEIKNGSLVIVFPENDDARVVGATYRYEPGNGIQKL